MSAADNLEKMGLKLLTPAAPAANYLPTVRVGNILYISGQISTDEAGVITGQLGRELGVEAGQAAAKRSALSLLTHIVHSGGVPLDKVKRFVKLTVLVASAPDFFDHHLVANGASDFLVAVLGDRGRHARAAFGVAALPLGAAVEIEAIVEIAD